MLRFCIIWPAQAGGRILTVLDEFWQRTLGKKTGLGL
jgi:hypothetical protein